MTGTRERSKGLLAVALAIGSYASRESAGTFTGLIVEDITANNDGLKEYAVYATFDDPHDVLLIIGDANIVSTTGFFHNAIDGGQQSALPFTGEMNANSDNPDADSFVTVGLFSGDGNTTELYLPFDVDAFLFGNNLGTNAAWGNAFPPNLNGQAGPDGRVLIAVFTPLNDRTGRAGIVRGTLTVGYDDGQFPPSFATASFITPAPGAVGLLALAGVAGRSRRRRRSR